MITWRPVLSRNIDNTYESSLETIEPFRLSIHLVRLWIRLNSFVLIIHRGRMWRRYIFSWSRESENSHVGNSDKFGRKFKAAGSIKIKSNVIIQGIRLKEMTSSVRNILSHLHPWWIHVMWEVELAEPCKIPLVSSFVHQNSVSLHSLPELSSCALLWN